MKRKIVEKLINGLFVLLSFSFILSSTSCSNLVDNSNNKGKIANFVVSEAKYPEMAKYPEEEKYTDASGNFDDEGFDKEYSAWREDRKKQKTTDVDYLEGVNNFVSKSIEPLLFSGEENENIIYSPLNLYIAFSMLTEITDGNSRSQILDVLGETSIDAVREKANALWAVNYCNDGASFLTIANSLWLNKKVEFISSTMEFLADNYKTSSYIGEMGSEEFDKAFQTWINEQTGGLLSDQVSTLKMDPIDVMMLVSTVYFKEKWDSEFSENLNSDEVFYSPDGETECEFMNQKMSCNYYYSDNFSAVSKDFVGRSKMYFILPDEGILPKELLQDAKTKQFIVKGGSSCESKFLTVNLSVPKFDVSSDIDLVKSMKIMGIEDVFDPDVSDFSPMMNNSKGAFLGRAKHASRVTIDEEGCAAASYVVMTMCGAAMPPEEEIDFVLDRPFLFVISTAEDLPLYIGVIYKVES